MKKLSLMSLSICLLVTSFAFAQPRPGYGRDVEVRISDLEYKLEQANRRIELIERELFRNPPRRDERVDVSCLTVDTAFGKTFLAAGRTKLEAEASVRQSCSQSVNSAYCNGAIKCSSGFQEISTRGALCVVTDTAFGRTFKADGKNTIEAEAKAKQLCQNSVNSAYCGTAQARCETF